MAISRKFRDFNFFFENIFGQKNVKLTKKVLYNSFHEFSPYNPFLFLILWKIKIISLISRKNAAIKKIFFYLQPKKISILSPIITEIPSNAKMAIMLIEILLKMEDFYVPQVISKIDFLIKIVWRYSIFFVSEIKYAKPKRGKTAQGVWKDIVNVADYTQTLRMEKCL